MSQYRYHFYRWLGCLLREHAFLRDKVYWPLKCVMRRRLSLNYHMQNAENSARAEMCISECCDSSREREKLEVGILSDPLFGHEHYVASCLKLGVAYRIVDLFNTDWIEQVLQSKCSIFVVWPGECISEWKKLFDERLLFLTRELGKQIYPSYGALWLYGSKERQRDWLKINGFPHPKTWVFYRVKEALAFVSQASYPLVAKTDIGAASYGVRILKTRRDSEQLIRKVFAGGIVSHRRLLL